MVILPEVGIAARKLGLRMGRDQDAEGLVDGRRVWIKIDWRAQMPHVSVGGRLDPPMDLGLEMRRRDVVWTSLGPVSTGSDDLDSEFLIEADEPRRAATLFAPAVRDLLVALHRATYELRLRDGGCSFHDTYSEGVDAWIVRAAHAAAETAAIVDAARAGVPPAAPLRGHAAAIRTLSAARGLSIATTPLSATGAFDGRPIEIRSTRTRHRHHHLTLRAGFETDLGLDLAVRREGLLDGLSTLFGGQDMQVGDAAFDRRFLVRADPAHAGRVPGVLDHAVCAALVAIDERVGAVAVDDGGITVDPIEPSVAPPEALVAAVDAIDEARGRIAHNLLHGREGGPYR